MPPPGRKDLPPSIIRAGPGFAYQQQSLGVCGPSRPTIEEAVSDQIYVLGDQAGRKAKDIRADKDKLSALQERSAQIMKEGELQRAMQHRCGAYLVSLKSANRLVGTAFRYTYEDALEARAALIAKRDGSEVEVPFDAAGDGSVSAILGQPFDKDIYYPVFLGSCGCSTSNSALPAGRSGEQRMLIRHDHKWLEAQDCCVEHQNSRGGIDRCDFYKETTPTSVKVRVEPVLLAAESVASSLDLPIAIYLQKKVHLWLFRRGEGDRDELWNLLSKYPVVIGPHFSRINRQNVDELWPTFKKLGFVRDELQEIAEHRSTLQKANAFGSNEQSELSVALQGSAGFRQRPENINKRRRHHQES